jgi:hypothetical protein
MVIRSIRTTAAKHRCGGRIYRALLLLSTSSLPLSVRTFQPSSPPIVESRARRQRTSSSTAAIRLPQPSSAARTAAALNAVSRRQTFVLDGGELQSFLLHAANRNVVVAPPAAAAGRDSDRVGCLTFVAGTIADAAAAAEGRSSPSSSPRRVVGVEKNDDGDDYYDAISLGDDVRVYKHTVATIPDGVSDGDALSTAAAALVGIHCALPKVEAVGGGSDDAVFYSGKVSVRRIEFHETRAVMYIYACIG